MIPRRLVDADPHEPAKQQIELETLRQQSLRTHRVERLQQHRPQQLLRRDGQAADLGVERHELPLHRSQGVVHEQPDRAQRMILAHPLFEIHVTGQRSRSLVQSTQISLPLQGD